MFTTDKKAARMRMSRLLVTDGIQRRIRSLPVDAGEFAADVLSACSASDDVCRLDETEVFAVMEMAEKLNVPVRDGKGAVKLKAEGNRAVLKLDFSALHALLKRVQA